jgi:2'-5' RNA ligase
MARSGAVPAARLFFGVPVGAPLRDALGALASAIAARAQGRAVPVANLHATLAFLGTVPRDRIAELRAIGDALRAPRCEIELDRIGSFRGARVAWIGTASIAAPLTALQADLAQRLARAGWTLDERPFNLHVTLARHCRVALASETVPALAWPVADVALFESIGTPGGPRYEPLATWSLA